MKPYILAAALLLSPLAAFADSAGGFVRGGLSFVSYEEEYSFSGDRVELDRGDGFNLTGGVRFEPGLMIRAGYTSSSHDGGEFDFPGLGSGEFDDEVDLSELRIGLFYAPPEWRVVGFRVGAGIEKFELESPSLGIDSTTDGLFAEAAVLLNAGHVATFEVGVAVMSLENDDNDDVAGGEFTAGVQFHAGPVDIGLGFRGLGLVTEYDDGEEQDTSIGEFRVTLGGTWGYPEGHRRGRHGRHDERRR